MGCARSFERKQIGKATRLHHVANSGVTIGYELGRRFRQHRWARPQRKHLASQPVDRARNETNDIHGAEFYRKREQRLALIRLWPRQPCKKGKPLACDGQRSLVMD